MFPGPDKVFFTKGVGYHIQKLQAFELALRAAGVEKQNLVTVSSILPPGCKIISKAEGLKKLKPGAITFTVIARNETNEPNRLIAASVGLAQPADKGRYGYLSEHHSFGQKEKIAADYAEDLAATMLASTLGINFNPDRCYDERKEVYQLSGKIVRATNITQTAMGQKDGLWTNVVALAIFLFDDK